MINRRTFLQQVGAGMAAGAAGWSLAANPLWAWPAHSGSNPPVRIALLADGHLRRGPAGTAAVDHLLAAVSEINAIAPPIDVVFYLGDLTAEPDPRALALGQEILDTLAAPCWLLPGEHDPWPAAASHRTHHHGGLFSFTWRGVHFCGLDTRSGRRPGAEPQFHLTPPTRQWLAEEIQGLPPDMPLLIFTHAPLYTLYRPWQWYTAAAESLPALLRLRPQVLLLHGHIHQHLGLRLGNLWFQGVRSTAWSLPDVHVGTTAARPCPPGPRGRAGCGWLLLSVSGHSPPLMLDHCWTT